MASGQQKTVEGLQTALQMEIDGKEFYAKASQASGNELGKKLLAQLASEEDYHRRIFASIYESIRKRQGWPEVEFHPDGGGALRTVFSANLASAAKTSESELDAVTTARAMETKTYDFYQAQKKQASHPAEKDFYDRLAAQEQQHNLVLADYYEYLQNPEGWFVKKEHPSLD
jgi:rubrerythrin